jgi:hypothetical protein
MQSKWFCKSCVNQYGAEVEILTVANVFKSPCVKCGETADYLVANSDSLLTQLVTSGEKPKVEHGELVEKGNHPYL